MMMSVETLLQKSSKNKKKEKPILVLNDANDDDDDYGAGWRNKDFLGGNAHPINA